MSKKLGQFSDEALIAGIGERWPLDTVFAELYARHRTTVVGWCLRVLHNDQDAADAAQDAFLTVHRELPNFRADSRFTTWLYVVVRRAAIDRLRRDRAARDKAARAGREPPPQSEAPADAVADDAVYADLRQTLARVLEPDEAQVVYLHYALGMTLPAITQMLDLRNASGAKAPLVAALRKLRRHYGDDATAYL